MLMRRDQCESRRARRRRQETRRPVTITRPS